MKLKPNKTSASCVGKWVQKALYGSAVLGLAMTMGATSALAGNGYGGKGNGNSYGNDGFETLTPFVRVAKLPAVRNSAGEVDHVATYKKARAASIAIATFVARKKEGDPSVLGPEVIQGIDWKLGGTDKTCLETRVCSDEMIDHNVLAIPSPEKIDPTAGTSIVMGLDENLEPIIKPNVKKGNVIEFCNKRFASMAMGVPGAGDILPGRTVENGWAHAPALPCEVSVWNDDENIYVDMLDPSAIFTLFFSDVLFSEDMQDPEFADALNAMPPQVKGEIVAIIHAALADFDPDTKAMDKKIGPKYKSIGDIVSAVDASPLDSPYLHMVYTKQGGGIFTDGTNGPDESKLVAQTIIDTMSKHGDPGAGTHTTIINEDGDTLDSILSPDSSWRSARTAPISIPGKNHIIEACSPKYAKLAMGTGLHHVNALPCEITVKIIDGGNKLVISYLDPYFMLGALFADITDEEKAAFAHVPGLINADLKAVVKAALDVNLGIALNEPTRKVINMLPEM